MHSPEDVAKQLVKNAYVQKVVRRKARQLARLKEFKSEDPEDIEQDLFTHLVKQAGKYDPAVGSLEAFAGSVAEREAITLIRRKQAKQRGYGRRTLSLDAPVTDENGKSGDRGSLISEEDASRRTGSRRCSAEGDREAAQEIAAFLSHLPPDLRDIVERRRSASVRKIASDLGLSPQTVYSRLDDLRKFIEAEDLEKYLRDF